MNPIRCIEGAGPVRSQTFHSRSLVICVRALQSLSRSYYVRNFQRFLVQISLSSDVASVGQQ